MIKQQHRSSLLPIIFSLVFFLVLIYFPTKIDAAPREKPLIGILLDSGGNEGYSEYPWYALRKNYGQVIANLGGIPLFIGHDSKVTEDYLNILDGIVLTGGDFESPPEAYTTGIKGKVDQQRFARDYMEFGLVQKAYERNIPTIGICAGMQNMNVALGGTLYKNLKESLGTTIEHRKEDNEKVQHPIQIQENTKLFHILRVKFLQVNSNHNEGINKVAAALTISARAPDGVIEGIEAPQKLFFMGVMWHPEFLLSQEETDLWKSFIAAALTYHSQHKSVN